MSRHWLAATLITLMALVGCSADGDVEAGDASPTPTPTSSSATATPEDSPSEEASPSTDASAAAREFVAAVREKVPEITTDRTDEEIAAIGLLACQGLSSGQTAEQLIAVAQSLGTLDATATDPATARELVKLAIDTTCPDQAGRVDEF